MLDPDPIRKPCLGQRGKMRSRRRAQRRQQRAMSPPPQTIPRNFLLVVAQCAGGSVVRIVRIVVRVLAVVVAVAAAITAAARHHLRWKRVREP